jgi:hypothetical protein
MQILVQRTLYIVTNMTIARQWLAKHIPDRYAVNKNRRPLLDNGFGYHGIRHVPVTTFTTKTVLEPFKAVISTQFAKGHKKRPDDQETECIRGRESEPVSERVNW